MRAALGISIAAAALCVLIGFQIAAQLGERDLADACWDRGGIPVQGDATAGDPVVCLNPSVLLDGAQ